MIEGFDYQEDWGTGVDQKKIINDLADKIGPGKSFQELILSGVATLKSPKKGAATLGTSFAALNIAFAPRIHQEDGFPIELGLLTLASISTCVCDFALRRQRALKNATLLARTEYK